MYFRSVYTSELECIQVEHKWKLVADLAVPKCDLNWAADALVAAQDEPALMLLASATGDRRLVESVAERAQTDLHWNTAFLAYFVLGKYSLTLTDIILNRFMT